ncbi:SMC5-SMC6 complex localization factor protein 1 isoform X2 [Nothobranchius furzeri]|uniref:Transcript variant X2 n=1 Tax=Nothobranchius furzeri TaxID=105023 RepID=A0A9D3B9C5_NOTFU|nr:transcript variant X2 [Nothobranchius furzeri]
MEVCRHIFQISGIKNREKKRILLKGINQLGGKYIGGSVYKHYSTHLIIPQVLPGEKFLAFCAAGKWVVTPKYVLDSVKNGSWLDERSYEVAIFTRSSAAFYPVRQWREKVTNRRITGAFQGWRVLLMVQEPTRRDMFKRLLKAGRAEVYNSPPPTFTSITHVMAKPVTESSKSQDAPCYPVSHIVQHLFGSNCVDMKLNIQDHLAEKDSYLDEDYSNLEAELKSVVIEKEGQPRLRFLQFLGYHDPHHPHSQAILADFSNVGTMIECGLFVEALDSIRSSAFPGLLPPATYLISLLQYAQQGNATSVFLRNFHQVLENLLLTNPPWLAPNSVKKYYAQVLQCPQCKTGLWPFLETAIRYCLSSNITCHPLAGPTLPTLVDFHYDILSFCLKLFQGELHSVTSGDFVRHQATQAPSTFSSGSLLYGTFWTVWERSTLLSRSVKQLTQLIVQAANMGGAEREETQKLHLADTMLHLLSVLVEFWCQQHFRLNQHLVEKGLKDLSEHFAVVSQDLPPAVLVELVASIRSSRLKLVVADAVFRNLCCRNGFTVGDEPHSLKKMVCSYLPALGALAQSPSSAHHRTGPVSHSCTSPGTGRTKTSPESQNTLRDLGKVNAAGETLLHRACIRNQVEAVLQILAHPDTDINVKDHAGWTPLHEACNHGSTECVKALLHHRPAPVLTDQVEGVSPLHDALLNGHMDIAKMLLEHAGSVLLRQTDEKGRSPMDLVSTLGQQEELFSSAEVGDSAQRHEGAEVLNLPLLEAGSCLLCHLVVSYQLERGLPGLLQPIDKPNSLVYKLVRALETHPLQKVTLDWTDQRAVRLVEDVEMLLELSQGKHQEQVSRAVRECKGESTTLLMEILENLGSRGEMLVADL